MVVMVVMVVVVVVVVVLKECLLASGVWLNLPKGERCDPEPWTTRAGAWKQRFPFMLPSQACGAVH